MTFNWLVNLAYEQLADDDTYVSEHVLVIEIKSC
jgi:hypothetical protein